MKKVLWFATWYPAEHDPYTGDFIRRHAQATAPYAELELLHVVKSPVQPDPKGQRKVSEPFHPRGKATIIYYHAPMKWFPALHRLISLFTYLRIQQRFLKEYIVETGKPDGIHVHVGSPGGIGAWLALRRYGIPYIVSEHWTGLCEEAKPNFSDAGFLQQWFWKKVMRHAAAHTAVSDYLAAQMQRRFSIPAPAIIPNVVDSKVFFPVANRNETVQFIHISNFTPQKNLPEILEAAALLKKDFPGFRLVFVGASPVAFLPLVKTLGIDANVLFMDAMPQEELREWINQSSALILYSLYETFGCVVIEANACGLPVIVSDLPVFRENVFPDRNGLLVPLHNPAKLSVAMRQVAMKEKLFDAQEIRRFALEHYSYARIGQRFSEMYEEVFEDR